MKKFRVTQRFAAPAATVAEAYRAEATWASFAGLPFVGDPDLVSFEAGSQTRIAMAYRVSIDLPAVATSFIDPDKLTFVEYTDLGADGAGTFDIEPDHYQKLLAASGTIEIRSTSEDGCERRVHGEVDVKLGWTGKLFEGPVEEAIVNGFSRALIAQAAQVDVD